MKNRVALNGFFYFAKGFNLIKKEQKGQKEERLEEYMELKSFRQRVLDTGRLNCGE